MDKKIYQIFMGSDIASKNVPPEELIGEFNDFDDAYKIYKNIQGRCKTMCNEAKYAYNRNYCYMIEVNTDKRIYGYIQDKKIDNGYESYTILYHSYSAHPELHYMYTKDFFNDRFYS